MLISKIMKFVFSIPGFDPKSNGLNVIHSIAREFKNLGAEVRIIPWPGNNDFYKIPDEYADLYSARFNLNEAIAFLPDAIPPHIAEEIKSQVKACVWWLCNVPGLLGHAVCNFGKNDLLLSYSKLISADLPQLYYHSDIPDLPSIQEIKEKRKNADLVIVYTGKGKVRPIPQVISDTLPDHSKIVYISRFYPETKEVLYSLLLRAKFVISFDPISFLSYEANLLGAPVFLVNNMRPELNLQRDFNIPLHGFFTNEYDFLATNKIGLDLELMHESHKKAIEGNAQRVKKAFEFIKAWDQMRESSFGEFQSKIVPLYSKLVRYELDELRETLDSHIGSIRNLNDNQRGYLKNCVEDPKVFIYPKSKAFFKKLGRSLKKRFKSVSSRA